MRSIVIGLGIQGKKRLQELGRDCVGTVDIVSSSAQYADLKEVPLDIYDAAFICTPDSVKFDILKYLISHGKHVLVEKPMLASKAELGFLKDLSSDKKISFYTAYNHRFEPHIQRLKNLLESKALGKIYYCKMVYGNGTAQDIKNSPWRNRNAGVLTDLGSHLLDIFLYFFEKLPSDCKVVAAHRFETNSFDHALIHSEEFFSLDLEMSYISWKNHFSIDIYGENGSAHIESLCKWGPSKFIFRKRKMPSGRPDEEQIILVQSDQSWKNEYLHFQNLCITCASNISNDLKINDVLQELIKEVSCQLSK